MKPLEKILYIEDEADIQAIARIALEAIGGFTVETSNSGQEGLSKAASYLPDIILLDVMMPGMDGPSTLLALRQTAGISDTPVVFMTAKVQPNEIADYLALGALGVIAKPFDPMTLADQVRKIWVQKEEA